MLHNIFGKCLPVWSLPFIFLSTRRRSFTSLLKTKSSHAKELKWVWQRNISATVSLQPCSNSLGRESSRAFPSGRVGEWGTYPQHHRTSAKWNTRGTEGELLSPPRGIRRSWTAELERRQPPTYQGWPALSRSWQRSHWTRGTNIQGLLQRQQPQLIIRHCAFQNWLRELKISCEPPKRWTCEVPGVHYLDIIIAQCIHFIKPQNTQK